MLLDAHTHHRYEAPRQGVRTILSLRPYEEAPEGGWCSRGLHPWYPEDLTDEALERLHAVALEPRCVAIGEAGLDLVYGTDLSLQQHYFAEQIKLSQELNLPLVLHCVRAWSELLAYRKRFSPEQSWVVHGFRGKPALAEQLLRAGFVLSMGAYAPAESLRLAYQSNRLLLETDNAPLGIEMVYQRASQTLGITMGELEVRLEENAYTYLGLQLHEGNPSTNE